MGLTKNLPSLRRQAIFERAASSASLTLRNIPNLMEPEERSNAPKRSGDDLGNHAADAGAGQADGASGASGQVEHTAADERATVVDGDDDAAVAMGDPELGAERQGAVGRGHGVLVEALAGRGLAAGFIAVKGGHAREATSGTGRRGDRGIGVEPGPGGRPADSSAGRVAGVVMVVVMMMAVVMPVRSGRGFGDAATEQESCGENS